MGEEGWSSYNCPVFLLSPKRSMIRYLPIWETLITADHRCMKGKGGCQTLESPSQHCLPTETSWDLDLLVPEEQHSSHTARHLCSLAFGHLAPDTTPSQLWPRPVSPPHISSSAHHSLISYLHIEQAPPLPGHHHWNSDPWGVDWVPQRSSSSISCKEGWPSLWTPNKPSLSPGPALTLNVTWSQRCY